MSLFRHRVRGATSAELEGCVGRGRLKNRNWRWRGAEEGFWVTSNTCGTRHRGEIKSGIDMSVGIVIGVTVLRKWGGQSVVGVWRKGGRKKVGAGDYSSLEGHT